MLTTLYTIFIVPLEFIMRITLEQIVAHTHNSLLALVGVSLIVTVGSLPLYHIAEQWQNRERKIQKKLRPKIDEFKQIFSGATLNAYVHTLYRQNRYHPIFAVRTTFGLLIQIPFFFAAYHLLSNYAPFNGLETILFNDLSMPDQWITFGNLSLNVMPFIMTAVNIVSSMIYGSSFDKKAKLQLYGISFLFLVLLYNSPSGLLFYWTMNNLFSLIKNILYNIFSKKESPVKINKPPRLFTLTYRRNTIFALSLSILAATLTLIPSLSLMSTGEIDDFPGHLSEYFDFLMMAFLLIVTSFSLLYAYLSPRWQSLFTTFIAMLALYGTTNIFLFPVSYGEMSHFIFTDNIARLDFQPYLNGGIGASIAVVVLIFLSFKRLQKILLYTLSIITIAFVVITITESYNFTQKRIGYTEIETANKIVPQITFSKTKKNVVIFMLDRFIGGYVAESLKMIPNLNKKLDGFTWYRESLSTASVTLAGEPSIMGGWEYSVHAMHNKRRKVPLAQKLNESLRILPYNFTRAGFDISIIAPGFPWHDKDDKTHLEKVTYIKDLEGKYTNLWLKEHNFTIKHENLQAKLIMFSLFSAAPTAARLAIYENGKWLITGKRKRAVEINKKWAIYRENNKMRIKQSVDTWSAVEYLPQISKTSDSAKAQFHYMTNMFPHRTYITTRDFKLNPNGEVKYPKAQFKKFGHKIYSLRHLYTDAALLNLLTTWFDWMKKEGVYDNTRIILVSDHGRWVHNPLFDKQHVAGIKKKGNTKPATYQNLIMIKDFNQRGELKTDNSFMATCDIPHLALDGIIQGKNPYTGAILQPPKNKFPFYVYDLVWRFERIKKYRFLKYRAFKITKPSIFKTENWRVYHGK